MKIAVCTPLYSGASARFVLSLASLLIEEGRGERELRYFTLESTLLPKARSVIAEAALEWGADHLLWIDGDQVFPANSLDRLLSVGQPFVGCNYARRVEPVAPTALKARTESGDELLWTTLEDAKAGVVEEVIGIGFGLCLISRAVFEAAEKPWFAMVTDRNGDIHGEDHFFCDRARRAGFKIFVDHALSWQIGHVGDKVYTSADALMDRARWKMAHS